MSPIFTLLASYYEGDDDFLMCPCQSGPHWDSFWDYLFPTGLIPLVIFAALGMLMIIIVRSVIKVWMKDLPFIPRSPEAYYILLPGITFFLLYQWYKLSIAVYSM